MAFVLHRFPVLVEPSHHPGYAFFPPSAGLCVKIGPGVGFLHRLALNNMPPPSPPPYRKAGGAVLQINAPNAQKLCRFPSCQGGFLVIE